ncbi:MAG: hypothetical protein A3E74_09330 [Omnitrophica bacterium RIFCSPHIGHO2_12_FULL_44_12]|nr:MAG: hypothetical protein A3E74_09330 [Omnitrophica bacterium RIFCSPHIGHO2_12_FULL_44_12]
MGEDRGGGEFLFPTHPPSSPSPLPRRQAGARGEGILSAKLEQGSISINCKRGSANDFVI